MHDRHNGNQQQEGNLNEPTDLAGPKWPVSTMLPVEERIRVGNPILHDAQEDHPDRQQEVPRKGHKRGQRLTKPQVVHQYVTYAKAFMYSTKVTFNSTISSYLLVNGRPLTRNIAKI